ncbi:MAG: hypothetical protein K0S27_972 [Gammaproteobacteria bacterium]|jgi:TPR repeat protein|nr:hypothetical protein [Gammaproteobacteria bacterium]
MGWITKETVIKALQNDIDAQYKMGCWFYENQIIESAYFWMRRAAQQGHLEATLMLKKLSNNKL